MSTIQLSQDIEVDSEQVEAVTLEKKGAKISSKVVSVSSGEGQDLRVPEDSLIVRLSDGAEFVIRGEADARQSWDLLDKAKKQEKLPFDMKVKET